MTATHHRPKPHKAVYRRQVWCHRCARWETFTRDTGHWVCVVCRYVEMVGREIAPDPWVCVEVGCK